MRENVHKFTEILLRDETHIIAHHVSTVDFRKALLHSWTWHQPVRLRQVLENVSTGRNFETVIRFSPNDVVYHNDCYLDLNEYEVSRDNHGKICKLDYMPVYEVGVWSEY